MNKNILIVDGHHIVRRGLACLLQRMDGVENVVEAASGEEALRLVREGQPSPDVVVMDLSLEGILHGIDLAAALRREKNDLRIVVLTNERRKGTVEAVLQAGANAYLVKTCREEELKRAVDGTESKPFLSPELQRLEVATGNGHHNGMQSLSRRERQVLTLIARGGTTKSIAADLGISPKTVEKHRGKLARKLNLHSVAELTRYAIENEMA